MLGVCKRLIEIVSACKGFEQSLTSVSIQILAKRKKPTDHPSFRKRI